MVWGGGVAAGIGVLQPRLLLLMTWLPSCKAVLHVDGCGDEGLQVLRYVSLLPQLQPDCRLELPGEHVDGGRIRPPRLIVVDDVSVGDGQILNRPRLMQVVQGVLPGGHGDPPSKEPGQLGQKLVQGVVLGEVVRTRIDDIL